MDTYLRGFAYHDRFSPRGCYNTYSRALTVGAGSQWGDIQAEARKNNVTVVGGAVKTVGLGFLLGGGHGPISSMFGLAADQVLEMEVVTASGEILVINECLHGDLFYAMRGGGGSTYAVMISATLQAYPPISGTAYSFGISTAVDSDTFWDVSAYFHSQVPYLSDSGVVGYYYGFANTATSGLSPNSSQANASLVGVVLLPDKTPVEADEIFRPVFNFLNNASYADAIVAGGFGIEQPDLVTSQLEPGSQESVGSFGRIGSRLLDEKALTLPHDTLKQALKESTPKGTLYVGHIVAGKGVRDAKPAGGEDAVNPAWRTAYSHLVLPASWDPRNSTEKAYVIDQLTNHRVAALRRIAPDTGAYANEADPSEPNWQAAFWGRDNYARLSMIKKKWDPESVFYCFPCVGAEQWKLEDDEDDEHGGRLCKV